MDKQELIERMEGLKNLFGNKAEYIEIDTVIRLISELDEPQKVQVPQFVANWIKYCKHTGVELQHALNMEDLYFYNYANQKDDLKLKEFFETKNNQDLFARAWIDGYEVEKEKDKRYIVKIKEISSNMCYLNRVANKWIIAGIDEYPYMNIHTKHTKEELETGGFGEVFNSPLFEVEEVE